MSRTRHIRPSFFKNEKLVELPMIVRMLFIGLWTMADREGRMEDRPKKIKMEIFPCDDCDCNEILQTLASNEFIKRYEVNGNKYIQIINFSKHQKVHPNEQPSIIPSHDDSITKVIPKDDQGHTLQTSSLLNPNPNFKTPLPPEPEKDGVFKNGNGRGKFKIEPYLDDNAIMEARLKAPGWDIYNLMRVYDEGVENRGPPKNPAKAFPAWCGNYTKGKHP